MTISTYTARMPTANRQPNSSQMAAKIKSLWYSGMFLGRPRPRPRPNVPPEAIAISDWTICRPPSYGSAQGFFQPAMRYLT